jgi:ABC-type sugar transport system permease subunit
MVALVIRTVEAFKAFDIIYVLTRGGPANGTQIISYKVYLESFSFLNMGRGSALSFIVSIFILILSLVYIKLLYTEDV